MRLDRRRTEEQVERALKEHFNGWSDTACNLRLHEVRSLRRRLLDDVKTRNRNAGAVTLSSFYCMELRAVYHNSEVDATNLFLAIDETVEEQGTTHSLAPECDSSDPQVVFCLCRHMIGVRASVSPSSTNMALDFLRIASKLGFSLLLPQIWERGIREWVCWSLANIKGSQTWWSVCSCLATLLVAQREAEHCVNCSTKCAESVMGWVAVAVPGGSARNFSASPRQWQHKDGWLRSRQRNCWSYELLWKSLWRPSQSSKLLWHDR